MPSVRITEIFSSLQGESIFTGYPTTFVRLTGCPLRCQYCDTDYAFVGGERMDLPQICNQVSGMGLQHVTVTGGEPLAQTACKELLSLLCDQGNIVALETSGALPIEEVDQRVIIVMDLKTPSSGEEGRNLYKNVQHLKPTDQVKFVVGDHNDYIWAKHKIQLLDLIDKVGGVWFSPSYRQLEAVELASWILEDRLPVRLQIQLHKYLWGEQAGT